MVSRYEYGSLDNQIWIRGSLQSITYSFIKKLQEAKKNVF